MSSSKSSCSTSRFGAARSRSPFFLVDAGPGGAFSVGGLVMNPSTWACGTVVCDSPARRGLVDRESSAADAIERVEEVDAEEAAVRGRLRSLDRGAVLVGDADEEATAGLAALGVTLFGLANDGGCATVESPVPRTSRADVGTVLDLVARMTSSSWLLSLTSTLTSRKDAVIAVAREYDIVDLAAADPVEVGAIWVKGANELVKAKARGSGPQRLVKGATTEYGCADTAKGWTAVVIGSAKRDVDPDADFGAAQSSESA